MDERLFSRRRFSPSSRRQPGLKWIAGIDPKILLLDFILAILSRDFNRRMSKKPGLLWESNFSDVSVLELILHKVSICRNYLNSFNVLSGKDNDTFKVGVKYQTDIFPVVIDSSLHIDDQL